MPGEDEGIVWYRKEGGLLSATAPSVVWFRAASEPVPGG